MKSKQCSIGFGNQFPPDERYVKVYFLQQGSTVKDAVTFFNHYRGKMWTNLNGYRLMNW